MNAKDVELLQDLFNKYGGFELTSRIETWSKQQFRDALSEDAKTSRRKQAEYDYKGRLKEIFKND